MKTENGVRAQNEKPALWTEEKVARLKDVFKQKIETGVINESEVKAKVSTQDFLETHSLKSITLKLRRMRSEYNKNVFPPVEQETSGEKVLRFLSSATCLSDVSGPVNAPASTTDSSRYWRKFTDEQMCHLLHLANDLGPVNDPALTTDSSRYWRKFTDEQTNHLLHLANDLGQATL